MRWSSAATLVARPPGVVRGVAIVVTLNAALVVSLLVAAIACGGAQRSEPIAADLVLFNADIYTGNRDQPRAQALAIRGHAVVALGTNDQLARVAAPRRIDLGGRLVIPGINDAHVHEPSITNRWVELAGDFDTLTLPELLATLGKATREHPAGTWLRAELSRALIDDPTLTREVLDAVAPQHPVWLDNFAGHALVFNTAALRAAGIDPSAPPPRGGFIGRHDDGANDGWRFEYARYATLRAFGSKVPDADVVAAIVNFEHQAAEFGITSVQTFPTQLEPARLDKLLRESPRRLRWHVMRLPLGEVITPPQLPVIDRAQLVTFYGTKYFLDGTPIERGAALREPYSDQAAAPNEHGVAHSNQAVTPPTTPMPRNQAAATRDDREPAASRSRVHGHVDWDAAAIRDMLTHARASHDPLHLHIAGDAQIATLLDEMARLGGDWTAERIVIEHGDGISAADIARLFALGIVVVQNPSHSMTAELNRVRLGPRTAHWMPMRSLIKAEVPFALGSDGPLNPYLNIMFATQHPTNPREALTREQALVAYTQGAAYGEHTESFKGRLVPGAVADIAVLSQDIFHVPRSELVKTRSVLTIVGGRVVYDRLDATTAPIRSSSTARRD
jgi:predicted amidohydrolase YtcJ